jgi:hypothetical protein
MNTPEPVVPNAPTAITLLGRTWRRTLITPEGVRQHLPYRVRDVTRLFRAAYGVTLDDVLDYLTDIGGIDLEKLLQAYVDTVLAAEEDRLAPHVDPPAEGK